MLNGSFIFIVFIIYTTRLVMIMPGNKKKIIKLRAALGGTLDARPVVRFGLDQIGNLT